MAIKKVIEIDVKSNSIDKLNKQLDTTQKEIKETNQVTSEMGDSLDKATGGAVTKFKGVKNAIKGVANGFKSLKVAIIASGIGALLIAVVAITKAFQRSEEGQNKWAKVLSIVGNVVDEFLDVLASLGDVLISVFEDPQKAVKDLWKVIKENIVNRFEGLLELIPSLGKAIGLMFEGKWTEAAKTAADATGKVVIGVESITDATQGAINKTNEYIDKLKEEAEIAGQIADDRAKADQLDRKIVVDRANADRKIADLRFKSEQRDKFTAKERVAFLKEASAISEKITNQEIESAKLRLEAQKAQNNLGLSDKEAKDEEAQLEAKLINLETSKLNLQKRLQTSIITFQNEELSNIKAKADAEIAANAKIKKDREERDKAVNKLKTTGLTDGIETDPTILLAQSNAIALAEIDAGVTSEAQRQADAREEIAKLEAEAKQQAVEGYASALSTISSAIGQETAEGKALAIAASLINTYASIAGQLKAFSGVPVPGFAIAQAIATGVAGFAAVKNIAKVKVPGVGGGGGGSIPSGSGGGGRQSPTFNTVGTSGVNQLADSLQSDKTPIKAVVVGSEVTTQQAADRNIVSNATIG